MNKNISNLHLELLDKERQEVLSQLTSVTSGYVLGGGTALALQLNHRISFDFDFFSSSEISRKLLEKVSQVLDVGNIAVDTRDELTLFTTGGVKVTLLYYPFKSLFAHIQTENGLQLFTVGEIALQKAYAVGRRGEYRDYFDLYTILKGEHASLSEVVAGAKQVYGGAYGEKIFLEQLVYFGDISNFKIIPTSSEPLPTPDEVKQYFELLVKNHIG